MRKFSEVVLYSSLIWLILLPQASSAKSVEELNRKFEERLRQQEWQYEHTVSEQHAEFEARQRELNRLFEAERDKVLGLFDNDPVKAKKAVWQGEREREGRREVQLEPNLRVEVANFGRGKIEVTAVSVPEAATETAKKQAIQQAKDIAAHKLAERVRKIIRSQSPKQQIDDKRVTELVEASLHHSNPLFIKNRTPSQQPLCYVKAEIPIFNTDPRLRESTVESIIRREIPKPALPKTPSPPAKLEYIRKPVKKGPCTGLIVDATGKGFKGKPLIRIFSEDNLEDPLYSVLLIQKRQQGICDMYDHCTNPEEAKSINRVTANPIILPARSVRKGADIILSPEDAYALTVANFNDFLSLARVVIIYEGGEDAK
jgi:hypothetical protein